MPRFLKALGFATQALFRQRSLIFRPSRRELGTPAHLGLPFETVTLSSEVRAWWIPAPSATSALLLLPGRRSNITCELPAIRYFHQLGCNVLAVDYPGFGQSKGRPSEQGCYDASLAGWKYLTDSRAILAEHVVLYGRSLGAAVAAWLASRVTCRGLVFHGGFSSLPDLAKRYVPAWTVALLCRTSLDARSYLAACRCPVLFLHGRDDTTVPLAEAQSLLAAAPDPKQLVILAGDHWSSSWLSSPDVQVHIEELLYR